jgi:hypothetical protein
MQNSCGTSAKETEQAQILNRMEKIINDLDNTISDLHAKLTPVCHSPSPEEKTATPICLPDRPPLFYNLHAVASRVEEQIIRLRDVFVRVDI